MCADKVQRIARAALRQPRDRLAPVLIAGASAILLSHILKLQLMFGLGWIIYVLIGSYLLRSALLVFGMAVVSFVASAIFGYLVYATNIVNQYNGREFYVGFVLLSIISIPVLRFGVVRPDINRKQFSLARQDAALLCLVGVWAILALPVLSNPLAYVFWWGEDSANILDATSLIYKQNFSIQPEQFGVVGWVVAPFLAVLGLSSSEIGVVAHSTSVVGRAYLIVSIGLSALSGFCAAGFSR